MIEMDSSDLIESTVTSTRVRLARNLFSYPFPDKLDEKRAARSKEREDKRPARAKSQNRFHNYEQDSYDYDEMVWKMIREQQA